MKRMNLCVLAVVLVLVVSQAVFGLEYHIMDLGTLGGSESRASEINGYGQIVGGAETSLGETHAFIYEGGVMSDLGTLGGNMSDAWGINENGQIVGRAANSAGVRHAFLYEDGVMYDLGTLGGNESYASAINNNGQIACSSQISTGRWRAAIYENGQMRKLRTFSSSSWNATSGDINGSGQVAGYSDVVGSSPWHAVLWADDTITDLGTLPGTSRSIAKGINDNGQIVGDSYVKSSKYLGFIYEDGVMSGIGSLGFSPDWTIALAISNNGQIVGYSKTTDGHNHAFVYEDGIITDLGTLGGNTSEAWGINDAGMIVGWAETAEGDVHAVLWMPSPADIAIIRIKHAIDEKVEALEKIDAALAKEWAAYEALEELLESGDYGDLKKGDIVTAKQKIHSAIQHQEMSKKALERSIEKLEDALALLGQPLLPNT